MSICIPTYNQGDYIHLAVKSALAQNDANLEVVVSDNHCTDRTAEYLASVRDPRLRVVSPPRHLEMFDNVDFCVAKSCGEYINVLSSDDVLLPGYAQALAKCLGANPQVAFAYCGVQIIDAFGRPIGVGRHVGGSFVRSGRREIGRYLRGPRGFFPSMMIRRQTYETAGRFGSWKLLGDWDLALRLLQVGNVAYHDQILVQYRQWDSPMRTARLLVQLRETGDLYDTTGERLAERWPELRRELRAARRLQALDYALGIARLAGTAEFTEAERLVRALDGSVRVRFRLQLCKWGLATPGLWGRAGQQWVRQKVKALLYAT